MRGLPNAYSHYDVRRQVWIYATILIFVTGPHRRQLLTYNWLRHFPVIRQGWDNQIASYRRVQTESPICKPYEVIEKHALLSS